MKKFDIKVNDSSEYWSDFEGELSIYGYLKWSELASKSLLDKIVFFAWDYYCLSQKFGIALPVKVFNDIRHLQMNFDLYKNEFNDFRYHNPMLFMQTEGKNWLFPSYLFVNTEGEPQKIVSIDPFIKLDQIGEKKISSSSSMPIRIELTIGLKETQLVYYLDNDIFNSWIDNKKTKRDPEIGGKDLWVDNSDLAYLNTPRLNSFLRDLKKLCFEYGATDFEFENLGLNDFCEDGVMFNGKVVYYEDIVELLEPHQRIVSK
jgi:hypothetical protein